MPEAAPEETLALDARKEDVFEEQVVTASRAAQSPLDAPNSTSIITEQDIRLSGITKIQELLRRLAGVDVAIMTGGDTEVSIRGYNSRVSNKTLVLIDYRSVYIDLLGATFWETLPIDVEQIERIEVVRGPGSALYGANAFAGVINIITKKPGEGGNKVRAGFGNHGNAFGSATVSRRQGDFAYRLSAGYTRESKWSRDLRPGRVDARALAEDQDLGAQNARFDLQTSRRIGKDTEIALGGGAARIYRNMFAIGSLIDYNIDGWQGDAEATLVSKNFNIRTFYTRFDMNAGLARGYRPQQLLESRPLQNVFDVQAEYTGDFTTGEGVQHEVHAGATYRHKHVDWTYLAPNRENWVGFFGQDTIKVGSWLQFVASGRLDYVPYLKRMVPSPRGSVIVKPNARSAVRVSGSTAFRAPTFVETYVDLPVQSPSLPGLGSLTVTRRPDLGGDFRLERERVVSFDLGYQNQQSDVVNFEVTGYYLQVKDLITLAETTPETVSTNRLNGLDPESGLMMAAFAGFTNQCLVYNTFGGEAGARVFPAEGLDFFVNYALNLQRTTRPSGCTDVENRQTSQHKVNAGFQFRTKAGFDGELSAHYASSQLWAERVPPPATEASATLRWITTPLDAYVLVNSRVGYRFLSNQAEVSVTGFNLLNQRHQQHPFGQLVGRRFMSFLTYKF
jgi:iron complex outermembrane receptor protein